MKNRKFSTSIEKIKTGQAEATELVTLFGALLDHKLSAQQQYDVCQALAALQQGYALTADPRLEAWVSTLTTALTNVGFAHDLVRNIEGRLTFGTYLHEEKYAYAPESGDTKALSVSLHLIFFGKSPEPADETETGTQKNSAMLQLIVTLKTNLNFLKAHFGAVLGSSIGAAAVVALVWFHLYPIAHKPHVCPEGAQSVHGKLFLPLRDGTEVILAEGSSMCYCQPFNIKGGREVGIQKGSAYFEIAHDPDHPFFIRTPAAIVEIRGTGLNVDVNHERQTVDIAVAHGKVLVHTNGETTEVPPGQEMSISLLTGESHIRNFDPMKVSWPYPHRWILDGIPLEQFAKTLEERFHVTVVFKEEALKKTKITGQFYNEDIRLLFLINTLNTMLAGTKLTLDGTTVKVSRTTRR